MPGAPCCVPAGRVGQSVVVTETLTRAPRPDRARPGRRPSTVWVAFLAAAAAALAGLAVTGALVLVGWGLSPSGGSAGGAVRLAAQAWLLGHHGTLLLALGDVGLAPLGLTLLPAALLYKAGGSVGRTLSFDQAEHARLSTAVKAVVALASTYAVLVVLVTGLASTDAVQVEPVSTLIGAFLLAATAGSVGLVRGSPLGERILDLLPLGARAALPAAAAATGALVAAGALLAGLSLVGHHGQFARLSHTLAPGVVGSVSLLLLGILCVPNAAVWAAAYTTGPGFAVGTGTTVTAFGVTLGPVPAFPLLAALPGAETPPGAVRLVFVAPLVAGVFAGVLAAHRDPTAPPKVAAGWATVAGGLAGLAFAVLAALSGGPLGSGRMAALGPSPWQVGLAAAVELAAVAAPVAALTAWSAQRYPAEGAAATAGTEKPAGTVHKATSRADGPEGAGPAG